jgi:hypothetical protein
MVGAAKDGAAVVGANVLATVPVPLTCLSTAIETAEVTSWSRVSPFTTRVALLLVVRCKLPLRSWWMPGEAATDTEKAVVDTEGVVEVLGLAV